MPPSAFRIFVTEFTDPEMSSPRNPVAAGVPPADSGSCPRFERSDKPDNTRNFPKSDLDAEFAKNAKFDFISALSAHSALKFHGYSPANLGPPSECSSGRKSVCLARRCGDKYRGASPQQRCWSDPNANPTKDIGPRNTRNDTKSESAGIPPADSDHCPLNTRMTRKNRL